MNSLQNRLRRLPKYWWWILAALLGSLGLQLMTIANWSVWHDEGYSVMLKDYPFGELISRSGFDVHPPLYYLVLKVWGMLTNESIVGLRLFSVLCMLAAILVTLLFVRRWMGGKWVKWAAVPLTFGPMLIRYGQEMRMYAFAALLAIGATWLFLLALHAKERTKRLQYVIFYVLLVAALIYTHYFSGLVVLSHAAVLFVDWRRKRYTLKTALRHYWWWAGAVLLAFVAFLPWLPTFLDQANVVSDGFWIPSTTTSSFFSTISSFIFFRPEWLDWHLTKGYALMAFAAAFVLVILARTLVAEKALKAETKTLLLTYLTLPMLALFLVSMRHTSVYYDRYFATFGPLFYASIGIGLGALWYSAQSRRIFAVVLAILVALGGYGVFSVEMVGNNFGRADADHFTMRQLYTKMRPLMQSREPVVSNGLSTYFDVRAYLTRDGRREPLLYSPDPVGQYGNNSLLYGREDLQLHSFDNLTAPSAWLVSGRDTDVTRIIGDDWLAAAQIQTGYAKATLVIRK